ncbi:rap guanine nucleotide exchange factor 5-like [Salmo trutta]|uniref:rap guanine nucleotide exchange factor 5-like n=1 Tax=Salmo trutta TaxID=8032 RepID=UPI0011301A04|nr:rap guanine nucleotide exchange factor 5-like [Salmo trutta]
MGCGPHDEAVRVCLRERGQEVLVLQRVSSQRPAPSASARGGGRPEGDRRYVVVSGTPEKILEHLLSVLRLDNHRDDQESTQQTKESEPLLDDFLLTYLVFMSTSDLCQALLGQYPSTSGCGGHL